MFLGNSHCAENEIFGNTAIFSCYYIFHNEESCRPLNPMFLMPLPKVMNRLISLQISDSVYWNRLVTQDQLFQLSNGQCGTCKGVDSLYKPDKDQTNKDTTAFTGSGSQPVGQPQKRGLLRNFNGTAKITDFLCGTPQCRL